MIKILFINFFLICSLLQASEFTVSSYNVGGLNGHYDFLRAACMQKLIGEKYNAEPELMAQAEKAQRLALKILFSEKGEEKWNEQAFLASIEVNPYWLSKSEAMITSYKERPIIIYDEEIKQRLHERLYDLVKEEVSFEELVEKGTRIMAKRIFNHYVHTDIIAIQEATFLDSSLFPENYVFLVSDKPNPNAIAFNMNRFAFIKKIEKDRSFGVLLKDKETNKNVLISSEHLTGCNPFLPTPDSLKGDQELTDTLERFEAIKADVKLIAMDSNVTATHPRLKFLKDYGYQIDYKHYLEPTCTFPYSLVNTWIDWIAVRGENTEITNIPIPSVGLNSIESNMSDHKPIAAKIVY